jgi:hypothetical protein
MGLDSVELILRAEELFVITIEDNEAEAVRTVGDFYILICAKLNLSPLQSPETSPELPLITIKEKGLLLSRRYTPVPAPAEVLPWSPQTVWDCLVAVFVDQLALKAKDVQFHARIVDDLGVC